MKQRTRGYTALATMVEIAQKSEKAPVTLSAVAATVGVSLSTLEQLSVDLRRGGLIRSFRGPGGGYRLAKPVYESSVLDIVLSAEDRASVSSNEADEGLASSEKRQGQDLWELLEKVQSLFLQEISLADVVSGGLSNHPLLKRVFKTLE